MKNKFIQLFICACSIFFTTTHSFAQVSNYIFSQSNGTYAPLTVGFVLGDETTNDQYFTDPSVPLGGTAVLGTGLPIGFNFTYNDTVYDKFGVCANGFIILGSGSVDFTNANLTLPLSSGIRKVIAGAGRDIEAQGTASITYATIGSAPNRTMIVQWANYARFANVSPDTLNFQIRLSESNNSISVVYGRMQTGSNGTNLTQVGIKGATAADVNMRTTNTNWQSTTSTIVNTAGCTLNANIFPANGLTFTWLPPLPCAVPPTAGTVAVSVSSACSALKIATLTGNSIGIGSSLQWLASSDSINWNPISGAITSTLTILQSSSNYYRCVNICSGSTDSSNVVFVSGVSSAATCYCSTSLHANAGCQNGNISAIQIAGTNFSNVNSGCGGLNGNSYSKYADTGSYTTTLYTGLNYSFNMTSSGTGSISMWIDYNQSGTFEASEYTQIAATTVANTPSTATVIIPLTALSGKTGMRVRFRVAGGQNGAADACTQNYGTGETEDYLITIAPQVPCVAPPTAGTASVSNSPTCSALKIVSVSGNSIGIGSSLQWLESSDSINWTVISGATSISYTILQSSSNYYRVVNTCSGTDDSSNVVLVSGASSAATCYCSTNLHANAGCQNGNISAIQIAGTNFSNVNSGCGGLNGNSYSVYADTGSYTTALNTGLTYNFSMTSSGTGSISMWIDYNQNGTFEASEYTQIAATTVANTASTVAVIIPTTALAGKTGMRVRYRGAGGQNGANDACTQNYGSGETEDYLITLVPQAPCAAPPTAGLTAASDSSVCAVPFTLSLIGSTSGSGLTYEWLFSLDGVSWSPIAGASLSTYAATQQQSTYYRCVLTCSGISDSSSVVFVSQNAVTNCYCASAATAANNGDIGNVTFGNINNGTAAPVTNNPAATGTYTDFTTLTAQDFTQNVPTSISVAQINSGNAFQGTVNVYIDYNQNGVFTDAGETAFTAATSNANNIVSGNITIPASSSLGTTRMRVVLSQGFGGTQSPCGTYQSGETEDYLINIVAQTGCVAPPTAGLTTASDSTVCAVPFTLSLIGATSGAGMTYEWLSSSDAIMWMPIVGANSPTYSTTQQQSTYYRCVLTCSGSSDSSSVVFVSQNTVSNCYCISGATATNNGDIGNVTFGSINNGTATPITNNPAANGSYTDYTSLTAQTFNQSISYSISIAQINSANAFQGTVNVYIDYNQNGVFTDPGETAFTGTTSNANNIATGNIVIPTNSTLGITRMRVVLSQGFGGTQSSCGAYQSGETEDYLINIDVLNSTANNIYLANDLSAYPNPSDGLTNLSFTLSEKAMVQLEMFNLMGVQTLLINKQLNAGKQNVQFDAKQSNLPAGFYLLRLNVNGEFKTIRFRLN